VTDDSTSGVVLAVCRSASHTMSKPVCERIRLVERIGIEADAHAGVTVKHRSRVRQDPTQPNLRQVHLMHAELFDELADKGFDVMPGLMGENITTRGVDLLGLPTGARLRIGADAVVEITGLRNPCTQLDGLQPGLMEAVIERDPARGLIRKAGVMGIVISGGDVAAGDVIAVHLPASPREPLKAV
jgi:MOSC domain-containing protein YiiM